jgi:hypothetical protein
MIDGRGAFFESPAVDNDRLMKRAPVLSQAEMNQLCVRSYWKRVWIVQEIGAATQLQLRGAPTPMTNQTHGMPFSSMLVD